MVRFGKIAFIVKSRINPVGNKFYEWRRITRKYLVATFTNVDVTSPLHRLDSTIHVYAINPSGVDLTRLPRDLREMDAHKRLFYFYVTPVDNDHGL